MALIVEILTPKGALYKAEAKEVVAPAVNGEIGILPQHTDYIVMLESGQLTVKADSGAQSFAVESGVIKVMKDHLLALINQPVETSAS